MVPADLLEFEGAELAPELTEKEKALRDFFIEQYLKDYDPLLACIRMGFNFGFAKEYAEKFLQEPYVLSEIEQARRASVPNKEEAEILIKNELMSIAREGRHKAAARVAALAQLSKVYGIGEKEVGKEQGPVSNVMIVPAMVNPEEWGKLAAQAQDTLKKTVRD